MNAEAATPAETGHPETPGYVPGATVTTGAILTAVTIATPAETGLRDAAPQGLRASGEAAVTTDELRALAEAAIRPCDRCELTVPHAFEEPDAHIWDPNHVTVDPHDLLAALPKEER